MTDFKTQMISLRVTPMEYQALTQMCETMNVTKSVFIRKLIQRELFDE